MEEDYPQIVRYYQGSLQTLPNSVVDSYEKVKKSTDRIMYIINSRKASFTKMIEWEVYEYMEDIKLQIDSVPTLYKVFRSSKTDFNFNGSFEFNHVKGKGESLEEVASNISNVDYNDTWVDIANRNDLFEIDYDDASGLDLKLSISLESNNIKASSVYDNAQGIKVLGLDIDRNFVFEDDDLKALGHEDTFEQSVSILANLKKGDIPEFLEFGRNALVGSSIKSFGLTSIIRQMVNVFSTDDSLINFEVKESVVNGTDIFIKFSISSRLNNLVNSQLKI